jgi:hypothetical protein
VQLRHRRRRFDLHPVFVVTSAVWLVVGASIALAGALLMPRAHHLGVALVSAAIAAFGGWLLEAVVGHAHKVVPFIGWAALRARGVDKGPSGKPLMFADLYHHGWAVATYVFVTVGIAALCAGLGMSSQVSIGAGGVLLIGTGLTAAANLSLAPLRLLRASRRSGAR